MTFNWLEANVINSNTIIGAIAAWNLLKYTCLSIICVPIIFVFIHVITLMTLTIQYLCKIDRSYTVKDSDSGPSISTSVIARRI